MALASLEDVKRVLRITSPDVDGRDQQITEKLAVAEDWFRARARGRFDETAPATAKYHAIRSGATVHLPVPGSTVTAVRVGWTGTLRVLGANDYVLLDDRRVRIGRLDPFPYDPRETDIPPARYDILYELVEIDYTPPGTVPVAIRDGIAHLAAAEWLGSGGGESRAGVVRERIGDYEYQLGSDAPTDAEDHRRVGMRLLRPFTGARVTVT